MRWRLIPKQKPKFGDLRVVRRLLWFPTEISQEVRWLEWADIEQLAYKGTSMMPESRVEFTVLRWRNVRFMDASPS